MVEITNEQYTEYQELKEERDKTLMSIRTQMNLQAARAAELSKDVLSALSKERGGEIVISDEKAAERAFQSATFFAE